MATSEQMKAVWDTIRVNERRTPAQKAATKRLSDRRWREKNVEYVRAYERTKGRRWHLSKTYGLTESQFAEMLDQQAGLCAVCCAPMVPGKDTVIDHDHASGKVRGLAHRVCNALLGQAQDSALVLRAAAEYLEMASAA